MSNPLPTYLQHHLAGAAHAIELVEAILDQHSDEPLGRFAANLLVEIKEDRRVLRGLADRVASGSSSVKELGAWLGEKVSRPETNTIESTRTRTIERWRAAEDTIVLH